MIIPTVLSDSNADIQQKISTLAAIPNHPTHFQIDIIDGFFADNLTLMPEALKTINWHQFSFEVHLMVNDPEDYLGEVADSGAKGIIAQVEHMSDRSDFLKVAHSLNLKTGLALDLYSPISELNQKDLLMSDTILLMAVPVGFSGQSLNPLIFDKIKQLRTKGYTGQIEIDGGVNVHNIPKLLQAGATHLAVNSALWHDGNVKENLHLLNQALRIT